MAREAGKGFTLIELLIVMAILMTLSAIAISRTLAAVDRARYARAVSEIRSLEREILAYQVRTDNLPANLDAIGRGNLLDPWGNPYQYLNFDLVKGKGPMRKDRFLVPLNTEYDLYSMGKDGTSRPPLTAKASWDDIIRANDGGFVGLASEY